MSASLVSIITPCYNAADTIKKTIDSVRNQTMTSWEMIIIDDRSTDNTCDVIKSIAEQEKRIKLILMPTNCGAAKARNKGIEEAKGRYIAFIDADDQWAKSKLSRQIMAMQEGGWPLSFTAFARVNEQGRQLNHVGVPERVTYKQLLKTNYIGCSTAIYDTKFLGKILMPNIRKRQDYGLWLKILRKTPFGFGLNEALTEYLVRDNSLSSNKRKAALYNWKIYRSEENLSILESVYYFLNYAIRGALRSKLPKIALALGMHYQTDKKSNHFN